MNYSPELPRDFNLKLSYRNLNMISKNDNTI